MAMFDPFMSAEKLLEHEQYPYPYFEDQSHPFGGDIVVAGAYGDIVVTGGPGGHGEVVVRDHEYDGQVYGDDIQKGLKRGLKPRHVSLITLGGIIGTGLFLGSGHALKNGGPLGLVLGYAIYGCLLICIMQGIGEMTAYLPVPGGHMTYAGRFVDESLGFAVTWAYAIQWMLMCPTEISAVAVLMNYWIKDSEINNAVWITIALFIIFLFNCFPASVYGETEFVFSSIKILTIVGLIFCGICINLGAGPSNDGYIGFRYWKDPGPFGVEFNGISGAGGRFLGFWAVLTQAAFSYLGAEAVAVAAGESRNPGRSIPRSIRHVYIRIFIFYVLGVFILGLNCPSTDAGLGTSKDAASSPFVIAIERVGIKALPHIINGCLITSAWSAANADVYIASRSLFSLANQGHLPKFFMTTLPNGTPIVASLTAAMCGCLAYITTARNAKDVFDWLSSLCSATGLVIYICIAWTYLRFRAAVERQGIDRRNTFIYRSPFARVGAWLVVCSLPFVSLLAAWNVFHKQPFSTATFLTNYLPVALLPLGYVLRKLYFRTKIIPIMEVDLKSGARTQKDLCHEADDQLKGVLGYIHRFLF